MRITSPEPQRGSLKIAQGKERSDCRPGLKPPHRHIRSYDLTKKLTRAAPRGFTMECNRHRSIDWSGWFGATPGLSWHSGSTVVPSIKTTHVREFPYGATSNVIT